MKYDHMLNGQGSRNHHQAMIEQAQQERLLKDAEDKRSKQNKTPIRKIANTVINLVMR